MKLTFEQWMVHVNAIIAQKTDGLVVEDLPDFGYADAFADGASPASVAARRSQALRRNWRANDMRKIEYYNREQRAAILDHKLHSIEAEATRLGFEWNRRDDETLFDRFKRVLEKTPEALVDLGLFGCDVTFTIPEGEVWGGEVRVEMKLRPDAEEKLGFTMTSTLSWSSTSHNALRAMAIVARYTRAVELAALIEASF